MHTTKAPKYQDFAYFITIITVILTIISFGIAINTPPLSGPYCLSDCFQYPFTDISNRFPRDYYWMYPAILLSFSYLFMFVSIHHFARPEAKLFSLSGLLFAAFASLVLICDYFIQVSVIQPSLLANETDGISILSQFNPHGIFIVLEELGFSFIIISFFCLVPVFPGGSKKEKTLKWIFIVSFILWILSFSLIAIFHGIHREYRFEVLVISIAWFEMILAGIFISLHFREKGKEETI